MQQLGRVLTEDGHAKKFQRLAMKEQF